MEARKGTDYKLVFLKLQSRSPNDSTNNLPSSNFIANYFFF